MIQRLSAACYYVLALLTFIAAFNQLGIEFALLDNLILISVGGLALGFGLSFGLGGRDVMAGIAESASLGGGNRCGACRGRL